VLQLNLRNIRKNRQTTWFILDALMLLLLVVNLIWLLFDALYAVGGIRSFIAQQAPDFAELYNPIHQNFLFYDLIFVSIFLTEFMVRWVHAVIKSTYQRWYFYPFIHWYDLIGCIPASGARILRVLRIFSIVYRLQKYQVIDITNTRLFGFLQFYYEAFLEELTDRIVIKILSGTQEEVRRGSPLIHRVQQEVLVPRRELLVDWLSDKIASYAQSGYLPRQKELRDYLNERVESAMRRNTDLKRIRDLPVFGSWASGTLDRAVGDITAEVIHQILEDLSSTDNHDFVEDLVSTFLEERERTDDESQQAIIEAVIQVLEMVKEQVHVKHWRKALNESDNKENA